MTENIQSQIRVMIEIRGRPNMGMQDVSRTVDYYKSFGFKPEPDFELVPMGSPDGSRSTSTQSFIISGTVDNQSQINLLENQEDVIKVWSDTTIAPFEAE